MYPTMYICDFHLGQLSPVGPQVPCLRVILTHTGYASSKVHNRPVVDLMHFAQMFIKLSIALPIVEFKKLEINCTVREYEILCFCFQKNTCDKI